MDEDRAHDAGVIRPGEFGNDGRNEIGLAVGAGQGEDGLGQGEVGQFLHALGGVLDGVGQKFQLIDQVRKFRSVDLGKLDLPER